MRVNKRLKMLQNQCRRAMDRQTFVEAYRAWYNCKYNIDSIPLSFSDAVYKEQGKSTVQSIVNSVMSSAQKYD